MCHSMDETPTGTGTRHTHAGTSRRASGLAQAGSATAERREARDAVAGYHEAQVAELLAHISNAADRFREVDLNAFDADQMHFQYSRAARELWKFCNMGHVGLTERQVHEGRLSAGVDSASESRASASSATGHVTSDR
jgi:hypothetical protein